MHLQENIVSATMKVLPYLQSNGWIVKPTISSDRNRNASIISGAAAIGAKVKILVEQSNEEDLSDGSCECKYFLSGTVIAYLPPDEDEPMYCRCLRFFSHLFSRCKYTEHKKVIASI